MLPLHVKHYQKIDFNLTDITNSVMKMMQLKAKEKGLLLEQRIEPDVYPYLIGDPVRVRQILLNFLNNAIKFTEQGGVSINVSIESDLENGSDNHPEKYTHTIVRFEVKDTGIGISEEHKEKLFKSFSQEEASISRKYGGTGLGLAISKQLAELMCGKVGVESQKGVGSTFWFTLRFEKSVKSYASSDVKMEIPELSNQMKNISNLAHARILLAEDNIMNQKVALAILGKSGISVDIANNGKEAVEAASRKNYHVILMDMQMPELDGIEATEIIRNCDLITLNCDVPIVAMTANASTEDRQNCFDAGMNEFISKPFNPEELLSVISKYVKEDRASEGEINIAADLSETVLNVVESPMLAELIPVADISSVSSECSSFECAPLFALSEIFDRQAFLNRLGGDETILKQFMANIPQYLFSGIEHLKNAMETKDAVQIRFHAHTIKGIALNASAKRVAPVAQQIELAGKENRVDDACAMIAELEEQFNVFKSTLFNMYPEIFRHL
ncbi:MAG: response regulator [Desulfamplus sp.]|nr:response regulator [Desulfamplus sp.]